MYTRKPLPRGFPSFFLFYEVMEEKKMAKTCNNCNTAENQNVMVPYVALEASQARNEREKKRLIVLVIISWIATLLIVGIFTYERLQYDYTGTYEEIIVDAEDNGNANYIGQDGNIYNGEDYSKEEN